VFWFEPTQLAPQAMHVVETVEKARRYDWLTSRPVLDRMMGEGDAVGPGSFFCLI